MAGHGSCHSHPVEIRDIDVKIHPRYFPVIILATFLLFVLLGLALGFRPQHSGEGSHRSALEGILIALSLLEAVI
jgi:hypothetical protein